MLPPSISVSTSSASANRVPEVDVVGGQQLERGPRVGFRLCHAAAPPGEPAAMRDQESDGGDRRPGARADERFVEAAIGEIERVGIEQADHERVERTDHVVVLLAEEAAVGKCALDVHHRCARRFAGPGPLERETGEDQSLARCGAGQMLVPRQPLRRRRAGSEARLLRLGRELRLELQRKLTVVRFDDSDRRLDGLHGAIRTAGEAERVGELTHRLREQRRRRTRLDRRREVLDGFRHREPQLGRAELEEHSGTSHGGGGSASARRSQATAAPGAPRASAAAATCRSSTTRPGSPIGADSAICAATRSPEAPPPSRIAAA